MSAPLITIIGGVAEVFFGDALVVDFDDWNHSETSSDERQRVIEDIQAAGYRCVVHCDPDDDGPPSIQIFRPDQDYSAYITDTVPDSHGFAVYDPKD